jgi:hypothetical protein
MDWSDVNRFVIVTKVFALLVAHATFVSVAGWEIESHRFGLSFGLLKV